MTDHAQAEPETYEQYLAAQGEQQDAPAPSPAPEPIAQAAEPVKAAESTPAQTASDEPFPGFNALSADAQKIVRERLEGAEKATRQADELRQQQSALQGRLAPTQRELEQARRRLADFEKAQRDTSRQPIDKMREIDPDSYAALTALRLMPT